MADINMINQIDLGTQGGAHWLQAKYDIDGNEIHVNQYAPKDEWETFKSTADFGSEAIDTLKEIQTYINTDKEGAAAMAASLNNKSEKGHIHSVTVTGNASQPTFTGKAKTINASYTPAGTVSKPTFTGTAATISIKDYIPEGIVSQPTFSGEEKVHNHTFNGTTATISMTYKPAGTVSQPTFTGSSATSGPVGSTTGHRATILQSVNNAGSFPTISYTKPTCTHTAATFTPSVNNGVLSFSFTGGSIDFTAGNVTTSGGSMPTFNTITVPTINHTHAVTAKGTVSQPTFNGTTNTVNTSYTPVGIIANTAIKPSGTINAPTFTGNIVTLSTSYTPAGTVSQPTFTGTAGTATANYTPTGTINAPAINITVNTGAASK